jgi:CRISPR system Cascade subunit CasE
MFFSRITLNPIANRADYASIACNNTYKEHQVLWELFNNNPDAERDFIYRYEPVRNTPAYYIVSKRKPIDSSGLWNIQVKDYSPVIKEGQCFSFILRVNPVKTKEGKRHDIVMHEKHKMDYKNLNKKERLSQQALVEKVGYEWLASRALQSGFSINDTAVGIDAYQPHTSGRKKGKKEIRYSTMDFQGTLEVVNVEAFEKTLMEGIGKAKAFGCGLLLIRKK